MFPEHIEIEKSKQQALSFRKMASFEKKRKKDSTLHVSSKDQKLVLGFPHTGEQNATCQSNVACDGKIGRPQRRHSMPFQWYSPGMDQAFRHFDQVSS